MHPNHPVLIFQGYYLPESGVSSAAVTSDAPAEEESLRGKQKL
jgi:hypothetical protein